MKEDQLDAQALSLRRQSTLHNGNYIIRSDPIMQEARVRNLSLPKAKK